MKQECALPRLEQRSLDEIWWEPGSKLEVSGWAARAGLIKELQKDLSSESEPGWGELEREQSKK